jgi:hypothetical protein
MTDAQPIRIPIPMPKPTKEQAKLACLAIMDELNRLPGYRRKLAAKALRSGTLSFAHFSGD